MWVIGAGTEDQTRTNEKLYKNVLTEILFTQTQTVTWIRVVFLSPYRRPTKSSLSLSAST